MRRLMITILVAVCLGACATTDPRLPEFASQMGELHNRLATRQITQLEHSKQQLDLIQHFFPEKPKLIEYASYLVVLDTKAERGEISPEDREYLKAKKWAEYEEGRKRVYARQAINKTQPLALPQAPTTYNRVGNMIYGSDGSSCNIIGASMYCN